MPSAIHVGRAAARVMGAVRGIAAREARDMHSACVRAVCRLLEYPKPTVCGSGTTGSSNRQTHRPR
eukprot:6239846-Prymnesium_polylepis.1